MNASSNVRFVGIRPRVKKTAEGESRPTQVCIIGEDGQKSVLDLEDEQAELDFVLGKLIEGGSIGGGIKNGDIIAMVLGGSGDYLAFALSRRGEEIGAVVERIPPFLLQEKRGTSTKENDAETLAFLVQTDRQLFTPVFVRDRQIVKVRELYRLRTDTMKARMACDQRLRQRFIGQIFCNEEGRFPEGAIEKEFAAQKATDMIYQAIETEEKRANKELLEAVEATDVWKRIFEPIEGVGPAIAARFITAIQDVRRFSKSSKLKKFCGAHVLDDGRFPRRRNGEVANWHPEARQALYLLADQLFRRPNSDWGKKLRANMENFQCIHPHPVLVVKVGESEERLELRPGTFTKDGKGNYTFGDRKVRGTMKYNPLHIRKMAMWRTVSQFVEWLFDEWWKLERKAAKPEEKSADEAAA